MQQRDSATCTIHRNFGSVKDDVRYDGTRGDDPISERSWFNEKVYRSGCWRTKASRRQVFKNQKQSERGRNEGEGLGSKFAFVCKDERGEKKSWQKALPYDKRNPWPDQVLPEGSSSQRQIRTGVKETFRSDGQIVSTNIAFFRDWFCCFKKDNSSANVRALFNCSRQGWQVSRIWFEVGNQSSRRLCHGIFDRKRDQCLGPKVLHRRDQRAHCSFWPSSEDFWVRSRRLQQSQHQESEKARRKERGDRSDGQSRMGGVREIITSHQARAGPGRGINRKCKIKKIRLQQTQCEIHDGNGDVWPALMFGLQSLQGHQKNESSRSSTRIIVGTVVSMSSRRIAYPQKTK